MTPMSNDAFNEEHDEPGGQAEPAPEGLTGASG